MFYEKYPEGSIQTEVKRLKDGFVLIKAYAYRSPEDNIPATGHAYEKEGVGYVNKTSFIENCETSAVGRALAMMGFEITKSIASREEMEKQVQVAKRLNKTQVEEVKKVMKEVDYPEDKFLKTMKVKSISDVPAIKYESVITGLKKKAKEK